MMLDVVLFDAAMRQNVYAFSPQFDSLTRLDTEMLFLLFPTANPIESVANGWDKHQQKYISLFIDCDFTVEWNQIFIIFSVMQEENKERVENIKSSFSVSLEYYFR